VSTEKNYIPNDYIFDIETYPNVFTLATSSSDGKVVRVWEVSDRMNQTQEILSYLRHLAKNKWRQVGFNNLGFDYPVLHAIMEQAKEAKRQGIQYYIDANDVYNIAMAQIQTARDGFAKIVKSEDEIIPQIDLFKINHFDNKAKATSLKILEFNMRSENIEDLPFPVGKYLSNSEIDVLKHYNLHDVAETKKFYHHNVGAIRLREDLTNKYGFNCMNLSDTDIGTKFFMQKIEKVKPDAFYTQNSWGRQKKQTKRSKIVIKDCLFDYVKFETDHFKALHNWFSRQVITETKGVFSDIEESDLGELSKYCEMITKKVKFKTKPTEKDLILFKKEHPLGWVEEVELKAMEIVRDENGEIVKEEYLDNGVVKSRSKKVPKISYYGCYNVAETLNVVFKDFRIDLGLGGLHGAKKGTIKESETHSIMSYDVASMYPNIAIANRVYPEHLGESFCDSYEDFYNERKKFSKGTPENLAIKLGLNSVYGKSNDKYSPFLDPMYTMKITINGQLSLCMLMEQIVLQCNARLIMANTDGFEFYIEKSKEDLAKSIVADWEKTVGLQMELVMYKAMYIRDVNNYYSVYDDNETVKMKGAYEFQDLAWHKNFSALIVPMAVKQAVLHGVDYKQFVKSHKDAYDFMLRVKVPRNCSLVLVDEETENQESLQNVCRYYPSEQGGKLIKIMPPLEGSTEFRRMNVESNWKVMPCNNMSKFNWNINYEYYYQEIEKLIEPFNQQIEWSN